MRHVFNRLQYYSLYTIILLLTFEVGSIFTIFITIISVNLHFSFFVLCHQYNLNNINTREQNLNEMTIIMKYVVSIIANTFHASIFCDRALTLDVTTLIFTSLFILNKSLNLYKFSYPKRLKSFYKSFYFIFLKTFWWARGGKDLFVIQKVYCVNRQKKR